MPDEAMAQTYERSEMGTPFPDPPLAEQHSAADSGVTGAAALIELITARRRKIAQDAPCDYCGGTLAECKAARGKDPTAPPWFGCCAHGLGMDPCSHQSDPCATRQLLDEIESGTVRTVAEVEQDEARRRAPRTPDGMVYTVLTQFDQGEWWLQKSGRFVRIKDMGPGHRYNTAAMLLRGAPSAAWRYSAAFEVQVSLHDGGEVAHSSLERVAAGVERRCSEDPHGWMRTTKLYRALTAGLTIQGDGTQPWQKTGRDAVTGEPTEVPPVYTRVCEIPACGCSGEAHA